MTTRRTILIVALVSVATILVGWLVEAQDKQKNDQSLLTLRGHEGWVSAVLCTPDGKRIVSGSGDDSLKVWDVLTGVVFTRRRTRRNLRTW